MKYQTQLKRITVCRQILWSRRSPSDTGLQACRIGGATQKETDQSKSQKDRLQWQIDAVNMSNTF